MEMGLFDDVVSWMESFIPPESAGKPGLIRSARLERMRLLLDALGHPEESFRAIHVAGSKGKGSVSRYLSALLTAAGYKTGLYLSPHLYDCRERFTLDGAFFGEDLLTETGNELKRVVDGFLLPEEYEYRKPTTFELYTAFAYLIFKKAGCTHAVIETGLGGRLDATNTLESWASVITAIEKEHTAVLGDTIEKIALEKAKIIKKDQRVFSGMLRREAAEVVSAEARRQSARLYNLTEEIAGLRTETRREGEICTLSFTDGYTAELCLSMRGEVQGENAALALLVARKLGFYVKRESEKAIEKASLPGRFEIHSLDGRDVVLDVCHTPVSLSHTVSSFKAIYGGEERACIFACIEGKETEQMLSTILSSFPLVIISRTTGFKKSDSDAIYTRALEMKGDDVEVRHITDAAEAIEACRGRATLIAGSFYLACRFQEVMEC